mmetsp:Transcript_84500/g.215157  ORF Transcript_84500/g.215157 Transcript_84500/m.215157 type:complete len:214 (+) Transcript_84500:166-807(+)
MAAVTGMSPQHAAAAVAAAAATALQAHKEQQHGFVDWVTALGRERFTQSEASLAAEVHNVQLRTWLLGVRRLRGDKPDCSNLPTDATRVIFAYLGTSIGMPMALSADWHRLRVAVARLRREAEEREAERELQILVPQFIMRAIKPQLDAAADNEKLHAFVDFAPTGDVTAKRIHALAKKLQHVTAKPSIDTALRQYGYQVESCGSNHRKISWA